MDLNTITGIVRPRHRAELPAWKDGDSWLAGGTWLFSEPQTSLTRLVDITDLAWPALQIGEHGLRIAATCTIAQLDAMLCPGDWRATPLFNQCCRAFLASFKIWNVATVGGNLCMALPAGPMIALAAALDGVCTIWTSDKKERRVGVADFVLGPQHNALLPGELLRQIELPLRSLRNRTAFRQISLSPLGRSAVLLIGTRSSDNDEFALTVTAATPRPLRLTFPRAPSAEALVDAIESAIPPSQYYGDIHGAPDWRRHMTLHFAEEIRNELAGEEPA